MRDDGGTAAAQAAPMRTALLFCLAVAGCVEDRPAGQQQFDLTNAQDRALFKPRGMTWKGVAGPYSVYRVTGAQPQLVGPHVARAGGAPSLLAGSQYFGAGKAATVILRSGSHPLLGTTMTPASSGDCIVPNIPGGSSGGEIGGETGSSGGIIGGGNGGGGGGDAPCDLSHNEVTVDVEDAPMNAVVLLGRVSLSGRAANSNEIFTKVCCIGDDCSDQLPPVK